MRARAGNWKFFSWRGPRRRCFGFGLLINGSPFVNFGRRAAIALVVEVEIAVAELRPGVNHCQFGQRCCFVRPEAGKRDELKVSGRDRFGEFNLLWRKG